MEFNHGLMIVKRSIGIRRKNTMGFILLSCIVMGTGYARSGHAQEGLPNVLYFISDDMGWGDPGSYNSASKILTPNIDSIASGGMRFMDAHTSAAKCAPSRYAAISGNYQWRGRRSWGTWNYKGGSQILEGQITLGDIFKAAGYATAYVGKLHLGGLFYEKGSDQFVCTSCPDSDVDFGRPFEHGPSHYGFSYSFPILSGIQAPPYAYFENERLVGDPNGLVEWIKGTYGDSEIKAEGIGSPEWDSSLVGPTLAQKAVDFIDRHHRENLRRGTKQPFFLYYSSQAAHGPYTPPASLLGEPIRGVTGIGRHADMIYEIDVVLGKLLDALKERALLNDTLVVFTSDNGGLTSERRYGHDAVGGLRGRKGQIYEGGHRVPFIVRWGDGTSSGSRIPPGSVRTQLVGIQDFVATAAALVGNDLGSNQARDSFNLLPVLLDKRGDDRPVRDHIISEADASEEGERIEHPLALRDGPWKLIVDAGNNPTDLYDLSSDLQEARNRVNDPAQASRVAAMRARLLALLAAQRTAPVLSVDTGPIVAAVAPSSRSVTVGSLATVFATIANAGQSAASACGVRLATAIDADFGYQATDPQTNQLVGTPNQPITISGNGIGTFLVWLRPRSAIAPIQVGFAFECANTDPAPLTPGLNTALLSAATVAVPDPILMTSTPTQDGILDISGFGGSNAFAISSSNVGAPGQLTFRAHTGAANLPLTLSACRMNLSPFGCSQAPARQVSMMFNGSTTSQLAIFATATGNIPFDPAAHRIFAEFVDQSGVVRGSASVAVRTQ